MFTVTGYSNQHLIGKTSVPNMFSMSDRVDRILQSSSVAGYDEHDIPDSLIDNRQKPFDTFPCLRYVTL